MLSSFRKAYLFQYFLGFGFIIICWIPAFFIGKNDVAEQVLNADPIMKIGISNIHLLNIIGLIVTLVSSLILNQLATEFDITGKLMTIGLYFFSLLSVSLPSFAFMNPFLLINFFLFFFIRNIFKLPNTENPIPLIFNASLMLGIASLYYINILFLIVVILIGLMIHRTNSWRNYITSLIGIILPYLFVITWYYWSDQLPDYFMNFDKSSMFKIRFPIDFKFIDLFIALLIAIFTVIAVFKTIFKLGEKNINLRRNLIISIYFLLVSVAIFVFFAPSKNAALIIIIPASLLLSNAFHNLKNYKWYNITFTALIILIIVNHFLQFIII